MFKVQFINLAANLSVAVVGFICAWLMLRRMDKSIKISENNLYRGLSFSKDILPALLAGNYAIAIYYGLRVAGALLFLGLVFSRVPG